MSEQTLWQDIKQHPLAMGISIGLHLILLLVLVVSLNRVDRPASSTKHVKKETVQAVVVDASVVDRELKKLKRAEQSKKNKELARQKKLKAEARKAREKRRREEKRLADLKRKQKQQEKAAIARQKKLEQQRKKKQQELAKLKKQKDLLEKKRQAEQQRLAAIEEKRKAEEAAALRKKQAAEAAARQKREMAELQRRMAEEERRQAEQNSRLNTLRAQYVKLIQQKVARNWLPPASMTKGWSCEVMVQQNILGEVTQVKMLRCTGSAAFKSTVERAVKKASPLPPAPDAKVFERRIQFIFDPKI